MVSRGDLKSLPMFGVSSWQPQGELDMIPTVYEAVRKVGGGQWTHQILAR